MATKTVTKYRNAPRKKRRYHRPKLTIPLAVVAGFASPVMRIVQHTQSGGATGGVQEMSRIMIGVDPFANPPTFQPFLLRYGAFPVAIGMVIHFIAGKLGVNRMLARSGVPLLRV